MIGWWRADLGVNTVPHPGPSTFAAGRDSVTVWEDQSSSENDAIRLDNVPFYNPATGDPLPFGPAFIEPGTATFGNGTHDVLNFFKAGWLNLDNATLINHPDVTIYAVVEQTNPTFVERREFLSVYSTPTNFGGGYGVSLGTEGPNGAEDPPEAQHGVRVFTGAGQAPTPPFTYEQQDFYFAGALDDEPDGSVVTGWHQITAQIETSNIVTVGVDEGHKELFVDGISQGSTVFENMVFTGDEGASIGTLGQVFELQLGQCGGCYSGGLAEIIVYSNADNVQRFQVEQYLQDKYFNTVTGPVADKDGDGDVDGDDLLLGQQMDQDAAFYTAWNAEYGTAAAATAAGPAPEPTTLALCAAAVAGGALRSRRRRLV